MTGPEVNPLELLLAQEVIALHPLLTVVRNELGFIDIGVKVANDAPYYLSHRVMVHPFWKSPKADLDIDILKNPHGGDATYSAETTSFHRVHTSTNSYLLEHVGGERVDTAELLDTVRGGLAIFVGYLALPQRAKSFVPDGKCEDKTIRAVDLAGMLKDAGLPDIKLFHKHTPATVDETLAFIKDTVEKIII